MTVRVDSYILNLRLLSSLIALQLLPCISTYTPPTKYVIVSNARTGKIGYVKISQSGNASKVEMLIEKGLGHPQGIAVDQKRQLLIVADSDIRKVVSYGLTLKNDGSLSVDEQTPLIEDVEARWVAVDGRGNVFISDEQGSKLLTLTAEQIVAGDTTAKILYEKDSSDQSISNPGGIAVDNFHIYWVNKVLGQSVGSVVRRNEEGQDDPNELVLASNVPKAYGICLAIDNVFYTNPRNFVYGVKTTGGRVTPISNLFRSPRGCVWDGDSTVYVADRTVGAVFAFHNPGVLTNMAITQVFKFEDAFGVAVFSRAYCKWQLASMAFIFAMIMVQA